MAKKILAPYKKLVKEINPSTMKEEEKQLTLFFPVNVFDVSQTEGEPLSEIDISVKGDNHKSFLKQLENFYKNHNIKVDFRNLGINGLYGYSKGGEIAVSNTESINTQVNTIIHEIAHELLHKEKERKSLSKQQKEIQAEATAYVVTKHFKLENKSYNYLALYDVDYKKIMENLKTIAQASKEIISFLEEKLTGG